MELPDDPYTLHADPVPVSGVFDVAFLAEAEVHHQYDGDHDWSAMVGLAALSPDLIDGTDLELAGKATRDASWPSACTRVTRPRSLDVAVVGPVGRRLPGPGAQCSGALRGRPAAQPLRHGERLSSYASTTGPSWRPSARCPTTPTPRSVGWPRSRSTPSRSTDAPINRRARVAATQSASLARAAPESTASPARLRPVPSCPVRSADPRLVVRDQRRRGVQQHDVANRSGPPVEQLPDHLRRCRPRPSRSDRPAPARGRPRSAGSSSVRCTAPSA